MCGIVGVYSFGRESDPVEEDVLVRARDSMSSRGPDGFGKWFSKDRRVAFGHRRLAIIDLSPDGAQPMNLEEDRLWITFNGEIYNYKELQALVISKGRKLRSNSDTEVLLHLYALYGESMCERLRGMFALAIWDENRQGMFLARDQFGIKPLYIGRRAGQIVFSSQVKSILAAGILDQSPDSAGHVGFFLWGNLPQNHTLYRDIQELPAGHTLWIDARGPREAKQYFDLSEQIRSLEGTCKSRSSLESAESLRVAVLDTVSHHFVADVPVGVFLSAGKDSTTLLATATEVLGSPPNAITLGFEEFVGTPNDEVPLAAQVAHQYGAKHLLMRVVGSDFRQDLGHILRSMDQPSVDGLNTYYVSKVTNQMGMKVALSGLGGDEIFGGYPSFDQIPKLVRGVRFAKNLPWLGKGFRIVTARVMESMTSPKYAGLLEYGGTYGGAYMLRYGLFCPWELPSVLDPDMVREGWNVLSPLMRLEKMSENMKCDRSRICALEMQMFMRNRLLRDSDWASMAHSVEIRVPFVDREFLSAVAPLFGTAFEPTKTDLARVPLLPLPEEVINRPKTGFSVPVREWILGEMNECGGERSLRGWARMVYKDLAGS